MDAVYGCSVIRVNTKDVAFLRCFASPTCLSLTTGVLFSARFAVQCFKILFCFRCLQSPIYGLPSVAENESSCLVASGF